MATTVDTVRTVFEAQFRGAGAVQAFRRELGLVESLSERVFGSSGSMAKAAPIMSDFGKAVDTQRIALFSSKMNELSKSVAAGTKPLQEAEAELAKYANQIGYVAAPAEKASSGLMGLAKSIGPVGLAAGGAVAGIAAISAALYKLYPVAEEGAGLAQLEMSFERLNANVLHTPNLLNEMRDAAKGTITTFDTMEGFLTLTAGASEENAKAFAMHAPELMEVAKAANILNPRLGDVNFMFQSLSRGIKRNETRLIDNLGLNVKMAEANKSYADAIGKTVQQLTAEDKQIATLNETLRVGRLLIEQIGGDTESLTDVYLRLGASVGEFTSEWKIAIANLYPAGGLRGLADLAEGAAMQMKAQRGLNDALEAGVITSVQYEELERKRFYGQLEATEILNQLAVATQGKTEADAAAAEAQRAYIDELVKGLPVLKQYEDFYLRGTQPTDMFIDRGDFGGTWGDDQGVLVGGDTWDRTAWADAEVDMKSADEIAKQLAKDNEKLRDTFAELQDTVAEGNQEVWDNYNERVAETGELLRNFSGDESLYTTAIDNIGDAWVTVGGRTEDQNELLEDLQKAYDKADDTIRDYSVGLKGYGMEQDKINEKVEDASGKLDFYGQKISELSEIQGESRSVHQGAIWDTEKLEEALLSANAAAGAGAADYALLKIAVGDWTEEQAEAAIKAAAMGDGVSRIAEQGLPAAAQLQAMTEWAQRLGEVDLSSLFGSLDFSDQGTGMPEFGADDPMGLVKAEQEFVNTTQPAIVAGWSETVAQMQQEMLEGLFPGGGMIPETIDLPIDVENLDEMEVALEHLARDREVIYNVVIHGDVPSGGDVGSFNLPERASGGYVAANTAYIVGERGPEMFVPNTSGTIIPNGAGNQVTMNNSIVLTDSHLESRKSELLAQVDDVFAEAAITAGFSG